MSWYFSATGVPNAVADKAAEALAKCKCTEPEETIKAMVSEVIAVSLAAFPQNVPVKVEASGSQSADATGAANQLAVTITPLWGFLS